MAIGYIQANQDASQYQYYGAWLFVIGIISLVIQMYLSAIISGKNLLRFKAARTKFYANEVSDFVFSEIRDKPYWIMNRTYHILCYCSGLLFIGGCVLTLIGVRCTL